MPGSAQQEAVLSVKVVGVKIEFYCFPDESVHVSRLAGKDFCLLKSDPMVIVDTMFGHCRFFQMSEADMTLVFFYSLLNRTARLTQIDLAALAGNAINSFQTHLVFHRLQAVEDLLRG